MWTIAAGASTGSSGSGVLGLVVPLVLMFAVFYFLLIRPQQKRQKSRNTMLNAVKKGDKVVTIGGIHGTIMELTEDFVVLRVNDATKMTFDRSAVNSIKESKTAAPKEAKPEKETDDNDVKK